MTRPDLPTRAPQGALSVSGADICAVARSFIGVRWRHQGRSREGVDCIGLPVLVRSALGLSTLDVVDYARTATNEAMLQYCRKHMVEILRSSLQPGDILVMAMSNQRHMAIVGDYPGGGLSIIHAYLGARHVVEMRLDDKWLGMVRGCFRFPEVTA